MSHTVKGDRARQRFLDAIALVESGASLPPEWIERTQRVGECPSLTFVAMLGTALLARATEPGIDPLTLKAGATPASGFASYFARSVATQALAPMAVEYQVDIGTRGREPLNNQPFFRYKHVHSDMVVRPKVKTHLAYLVQTLERVRELDDEELLLPPDGMCLHELSFGPRMLDRCWATKYGTSLAWFAAECSALWGSTPLIVRHFAFYSGV